MKAAKNLVRNIFFFFTSPLSFSLGLLQYKRTKTTPNYAKKAMRRLFVFTNGRLNDWSAKVSKAIHQPYENIQADGVLGQLSKKDINNITAGLNRDGFYKFDKKLSPQTVQNIVDFASKTPANYLETKNTSVMKYSDEPVIFDEQNIISPRYQFKMEQLVNQPDLQKLIFDQSVLAVAQSYLGSQPVLDLVTMWWSAPFGKVGKSAAAQMYHFDMARLKFLKFFFYLTDVDEETGPHCYVRGSHKRLPFALQSDGRKTDEAVAECYAPEDLLEICSKKGTILAVDTRGLHKGKDLTKDKRLLFQLEFATSIFGAPYSVIENIQLSPEHQMLHEKYPFTYQQVLR